MNKICLSLLLFATLSCAGINTKGGDKQHKVETTSAVKPAFTPPTVPSQIVDRQAQVEYVVTHYWDSYNFADSLLTRDKELTPQAFFTYASLLGYCETKVRDASIHAMLAKAFASGTECFTTFTTLYEESLYNPNSPLMNEESYIPALQYIIGNDQIDEINKIRPRMQLEMALKNRVGHVATDFKYTLGNGSSASMHSIHAEHLILYFNNPDCHDCDRVKSYMAASETLTALVEQGKLKILSIYPDPDMELWRKAKYPTMMINSFDKGEKITKGNLYDLKAIPTLYLLDEDKKVLLKDAPIEGIERFLLM